MKILVITEHYDAAITNGADVFSMEVIRHLEAIHALHVLARSPQYEPSGILQYPVSDEVYADPELLSRYLSEIDLQAYDLVYNLGALSFGCGIVNYLGEQLGRTALINHFQLLYGPYAERAGFSDAHKQLFGDNQTEAAARATTNIFASQEELLLAVEYGFRLKPGHTAVIPNGITMDQDDPGSLERGKLNGRKGTRFLIAGRLNDHVKGADIAFRAFVRLFREREDVSLQVIGDVSDYSHILSELPSDSYHLAGWMPRSELLEAIASVDVVLMPSRYEPFGLIALEAQYMGKPVIANDTGGLSEIVIHEQTGLLNPVENGSLGFFQAMKYLADRTGLCQKFGQEGHRRAVKHYNISQVCNLIDAQISRTALNIDLFEHYILAESV